MHRQQLQPRHLQRLQQHQPAAHGYTFLEILITIGIIALLMALLLPALGAARRLNRRHRTEAAMADLHLALDAYQSKWPMPIEPRTEAFYFDSVAPANRLSPMRYLMFRLVNVTPTTGNGALAVAAPDNEVVSTLSHIGPDLLKPIDRTGDGAPDVCKIVDANGLLVATGYLWTVCDPWGTELDFRMALLPGGRVNGAPDDTSLTFTTGTPPTTLSTPFGDDAMPNYEFPLFASAGPDMAWGKLLGGKRDSADAKAKDNLYSSDKNH